MYAAACVAFTAASMLSKEHGVTVLAVCLVYDVFVVRQLRFVDLPFIYKVGNSRANNCNCNLFIFYYLSPLPAESWQLLTKRLKKQHNN